MNFGVSTIDFVWAQRNSHALFSSCALCVSLSIDRLHFVPAVHFQYIILLLLLFYSCIMLVLCIIIGLIFHATYVILLHMRLCIGDSSVVHFFSRPSVRYNLAYNLICIVDGAVDVMWSMQYFLETCGSKMVLVFSIELK